MRNDQIERTPAERQGQLDSTILTMLVVEEARPWSIDEIAREVKINPIDSLERLHGSGLIHRHEDFVWATRAASVAHDLRQYA